MQAFEVLRSFGGLHDLSAALIIGGKDPELEKAHIATMNIIIATPGRLLQHLDETSNFDASHLKVMVMDEVDRMLDMGFKQQVDLILEQLPSNMQTLLFSATVTKSLKELARLKMGRNPEFIQIHDFDNIEGKVGEKAEGDEADSHLKSITPTTLLHYYMAIPIEDKLDTLFSFLKTHQKQKILVFFSSRKQVRFAFQSFKSLKVSQNLLELHGKMDQNKRTAIYFQFVEKKHAVLFSTDISARGVDFPAVDWVIQVDCPEDTNTYIHRVGRTARYKSKGNALLMLLPSELKFAEKLKARSIEMRKLATKSDKQLTIQAVLEKLNAENRDQMHLAKKAVTSYLKGVHVMKDKSVFKLEEIDAEKLAKSFGLLNAPQLTIVSKGTKNESRDQPVASDEESDSENEVKEVKEQKEEVDQENNEPKLTGDKKKDRITLLRMEAKARKAQKNQPAEETKKQPAVVIKKEEPAQQSSEEEEDGEDFFKAKSVSTKEAEKIKSKTAEEEEASDEEAMKLLPALSSRAMRKIRAEGPYAGKNKIALDATGQAVSKTEESDYLKALRQSSKDPTKVMKVERDADVSDADGEDFVKAMRKRMADNQKVDDQVAKERIKELRSKHKKRNRKEAGEEDMTGKVQPEEEAGMMLASGSASAGSASD